MTSLEFRGVVVRYGTGRSGVDAVAGVDLTVPAGTVVGLVGESGCGKSTLGRTAVGLIRPDQGEVLVGGALAGGRLAQLVFQDPRSSLNPRLTVGATIGEALRSRGRCRRAERAAKTARLLTQVGLDPACARQLPRALSGGQQQRVALARALAAGPAVLIADEITSALDVSVQGAVLNVVRDLQRTLGLTMLFISHDLAVVRYVSDRIAVMRQGRIVEFGTTEEILGSPKDPYTKALIDACPRVGGSANVQ